MSAAKSGDRSGPSPPARASADVPPRGSAAGIERWLMLAGIALLGGGMILVVLGTQVALMFMPGTWLILLGLVAFAAFGILHVARKQANS